MRLAVIILAISAVGHGITIPEKYEDAYGAIEALCHKDERLGAKFLRLAFHDCVSNTCDGCINLANADNGGLEIPIQALEDIYKPNGQPSDHSEIMSRADFWALASIVGVQVGIETANNDFDAGIKDAPLTFTPGRKDCTSSPYTAEQFKFPDANGGAAETYKFFKDRFGISQYETVALMGAHTLGAATKESSLSGFNGTWTGPTRSLFHFDGTYHHILLVHDYGWKLENLGTEAEPKYQWNCEDLAKPETENRDCGFMLNTDISMLVDLKTNAKGKPECKFFTPVDEDCGIIKANQDQMKTYDSSFSTDAPDDKFVADFSAVFTKVINRM